MDPASSALTLFAAAISVAKGIEKVRGARKHPKKCKELWAEIGDLVVELKLGDDLTRGNKDIEDHCKQIGIFQKVEAAKKILDELKDEMDKAATPISLTSADGMKAFWSAVVHGKNKVDWCRDELRKIREGLSFSLQSLQAPTVFQVDGKVNQLANGQKDIIAVQQQIVDILKRTPLTSNANGPRPILPPSYNATIFQDMTRITPPSLKEPHPGIKDIGLIELPEDGIGKYCTPWCSCTCHTPTSLNTYKGLRNVLGVVTVTHSGLPGLKRRQCSEKHCRRMASPKVRFQFDFPRLLWQRRLDVMYSAAIFGPEVRIKLPRVVDWTSPIWQQATMGNVPAVRSLFRQGLASPWDVSPVGGNLLHYATDHWNADLCRLLLEEAHVDPTAEDDFKSTAVCIAWERVLSGKMPANDASIIANLFKDTDYLASRSFTIIHKIVLGLSSHNLDSVLEDSTSQIDIKDSRGRTPLSWAAARGDEDYVRTLLKHKADPNIPDICGHYPVHYVQNTACAQLLLENRANLDVINNEGQTPLYTACRNISSASLTQFFISANDGTDIDKKDFSQQTPLHAATGNGKYLPFIDNLLNAGADINARNNSGDSPLRFAIIFNMHALLLRMLTDSTFDAQFNSINSYGQCFAHSIARTADIDTVRILIDARPSTLEADIELQDMSGKTSLDYFEDRLASLPPLEQLELRDAFEQLTVALSPSRDQKSIVEVDVEDVKMDVPFMGKFDITMRISDGSDHNAIEESYHDAVESF